MTPFDATSQSSPRTDGRPGLPGPSATFGEPRVLSLPSLGGHPKIKDVIYEELRERIVFGGFAPGDRLVEADLAARFGVSKTPVREALLTLEAEGMVVLRPHRGAEVSPLTVEEWNDLIFLRDVLEIGALPDIFEAMTDEHFEQAEAALAEMTAACTESDYRRYRRAQRQLHGIILGSPGRPSLPETGPTSERQTGPVRATAGHARSAAVGGRPRDEPTSPGVHPRRRQGIVRPHDPQPSRRGGHHHRPDGGAVRQRERRPVLTARPTEGEQLIPATGVPQRSAAADRILYPTVQRL